MTAQNWNQQPNQKPATPPIDQPKSKKTTWYIIGLIIIALLVTVAMLSKGQTSKLDVSCCDRICGEFNQACRGWNLDTLECTYNYERYGYPTVNQVFTFSIDKATKDRVCYHNGTLVPPKNTTVTFDNRTIATTTPTVTYPTNTTPK